MTYCSYLFGSFGLFILIERYEKVEQNLFSKFFFSRWIFEILINLITTFQESHTLHSPWNWS
jgi:hypothetical protein